jgi:Cobalamin synthesis protein cobW C-terminal domain
LRNALKLEPQLLDDVTHEHDADIGCVSIREPGGMDEMFHGVHMTLDWRPGKPWKSGEPRVNELVFNGRALDAAALRSGFEACRVTAAVASA